MQKKWELRDKSISAFAMSEKYSPQFLELLASRGVSSQKEIEDFFCSSYSVSNDLLKRLFFLCLLS